MKTFQCAQQNVHPFQNISDNVIQVKKGSEIFFSNVKTNVFFGVLARPFQILFLRMDM